MASGSRLRALSRRSRDAATPGDPRPHTHQTGLVHAIVFALALATHTPLHTRGTHQRPHTTQTRQHSHSLRGLSRPTAPSALCVPKVNHSSRIPAARIVHHPPTLCSHRPRSHPPPQRARPPPQRARPPPQRQVTVCVPGRSRRWKPCPPKQSRCAWMVCADLRSEDRKVSK